jgi:hypothetical protein
VPSERAARAGETVSAAPRAGDFDRDAAERVLRRAIELADDVSDRSEWGISEQALIEAADELGIDPAVVRRAATEERVGSLVEHHPRADRLVGPAVVGVSRILDVPGDEALARVDRWLRRHGALRRQRLDDGSGGGGVAHYTRRSDPAAGVQRALRSVAGHEDLGRVRRLAVTCAPIDAERSLVQLRADLTSERTIALAGGSSVAAVGSTVSIAQVFAGSPWLWLGVPASAALGVGVLRARAHGLPDIELALAGVLDRVAADDVATGRLDAVTDRLLTGFRRGRRSA